MKKKTITGILTASILVTGCELDGTNRAMFGMALTGAGHNAIQSGDQRRMASGAVVQGIGRDVLNSSLYEKSRVSHSSSGRRVDTFGGNPGEQMLGTYEVGQLFYPGESVGRQRGILEVYPKKLFYRNNEDGSVNIPKTSISFIGFKEDFWGSPYLIIYGKSGGEIKIFRKYAVGDRLESLGSELVNWLRR